MKVRHFLMTDYDEVVQLWKAAGLFLSRSDSREGVRKKLLRDPDLFLVAEETGILIGTVMGCYDGRRGWVNHLAVWPAYQGQGVGSRLMAELEQRLRFKDCEKVNLLIEPSNAGVQAFYAALGYRRDELFFMEKWLVEGDHRESGGLTVALIPASVNDVSQLAVMNSRLIADEGSRNPMNTPQLEDRMRGFLEGTWKGDLIQVGEQVVGYILYQYRTDEYFPEQPEVYLRQFFIEREFRRQDLGRQAIERWRESRLLPGTIVSLDVLAVNPGGESFWRTLGFQPHSTHMKMKI